MQSISHRIGEAEVKIMGKILLSQTKKQEEIRRGKYIYILYKEKEEERKKSPLT